MTMIKHYIVLLLLLVTVGCDVYPGPVLRNEFGTEIEVSVAYGDGVIYSQIWPNCEKVSVGALELTRWGYRAKDVPIQQITVSVDNREVLIFDQSEIEALFKESREAGHATWVLEPSGVQFSYQSECGIAQE